MAYADFHEIQIGSQIIRRRGAIMDRMIGSGSYISQDEFFGRRCHELKRDHQTYTYGRFF